MPPTELAFVTGNQGKFKEAQKALQGVATLVQDLDGYDEIQADTLLEVAQNGLQEVAARRIAPFFLEDAGLFVDALNDFPGVYSAYAHKTIDCAGIIRLLFGETDDARTARFIAVIAYRDLDGRDHFFTGTCNGTIAPDQRGDQGFGFDPIFIPEGHDKTFAEMDIKQKDLLSHRGKALRALKKHLKAHPATQNDPTPPPPAEPPSGPAN